MAAHPPDAERPPLPPAGWCALLASQDPASAGVLRAFGPSEPGGACAPEAMHGWLSAHQDTLPEAIVRVLSNEVDPDQAGVFSRRIRAVGQLLRRGQLPVLHAGLSARAVELLHAPGPRALRIRALADFYYSQAARLHHRTHTPDRSLASAVAEARWHPVAPGVAHARLEGPGPAGPLHVNLLRCIGVGLRCLHLPGGSESLPQVVQDQGAVAGVSGGFFLYSEPNIAPPLARRDPVGLLLQDGGVVSGPTLRRATLWSDGDGTHIGRVGPVGFAVQVGRHTVPIAACNDPSAPGPTWFNRAWGSHAPKPGLQVRGHTARGMGNQIDLLGGVLVNGPAADYEGPLRWIAPAGWQQAMAGGPMLIGPGPVLDLAHEDFSADAPPVTFSRDETYDQNLLPRMAAGIDASGHLFFAAIDGRSFDRAPGFTLAMTAELMASLGCTRAMNLDGGSSKRMAVGARCVDLASTEVLSTGATSPKKRAVVSAILVYAAI